MQWYYYLIIDLRYLLFHVSWSARTLHCSFFMHDLSSMVNIKKTNKEVNELPASYLWVISTCITYLHWNPEGFNGWQHISLMTSMAPFCPHCTPSHTATFLCKWVCVCVCSNQHYSQKIPTSTGEDLNKLLHILS